MNSGTQVLEPITESVKAPARGKSTLSRFAALGGAGTFVTLTYACLKCAYYWPLVQAIITG